MDGLGSGTGNQAHRAVVYDVAGNLLATSAETVVVDGQAAGWVDFRFPAPVLLAAGDVDVGLISGGASNSSRVYVDDPDGAGGKFNADPYSDGPTTVFGAATALTARTAAFVTYVLDWQEPANVDDFYLGRLPFHESQRAFGEGGPVASPVFHVNCGWHGTDLDDETGAFAIVQEGSPLEVLIGERLRISRVDKFDAGQVYVFCHNRFPVVDEISVPRRMFLALGYPAADNFRVKVEVMTS